MPSTDTLDFHGNNPETAPAVSLNGSTANNAQALKAYDVVSAMAAPLATEIPPLTETHCSNECEWTKPGWLLRPPTLPPLPPVMRISARVLTKIEQWIGQSKPELGGMLGGPEGSDDITHFYFDRTARTGSAEYTPDVNTVNLVLKQWNKQGIRLRGFVHSHPRGFTRPSFADEQYAARLMDHNQEMQAFYMPIVQASWFGQRYSIHPYVCVRDSTGTPVVLPTGHIAIHNAFESYPVAKAPERNHTTANNCTDGQFRAPTYSRSAMLERTVGAYDTELLGNSRVVVVGCGGARSFVEALARTGIGELALIDPDTSSLTNIGTQQAYLADADKPKVECLRERIMTINPLLHIETRQMKFETIPRNDIEFLLNEKWGANRRPKQTLLVLTTDSFAAQAHGNRVALEYGIPTASTQIYQDGFAAEFTFTHPETTPACNRCALESRYRAYLQDGFSNTTTSQNTPVFCADRINSTLGYIVLMLLHHGSKHPRWGEMLERAGNRNLVQLQLWPDTQLQVFDRVFKEADHSRLYFDNTVWLPQLQDHPDTTGFPICPDCGGTGNLHNAKGRFPGQQLFEMQQHDHCLSLE